MERLRSNEHQFPTLISPSSKGSLAVIAAGEPSRDLHLIAHNATA